MNKIIVTLIVGLAAAAAVGGCGTSKAQPGTPAPTTAASASEPGTAPLAPHAIGEAWTLGTWKITITGYEIDQADTSTGEEKNMTKIDVSYENVGNASADFTVADVTGPGTLGVVAAKDDAGRFFEVRWVSADSGVNPGVKHTNAFAFETPKGVRLTQLVFEKDVVNL